MKKYYLILLLFIPLFSIAQSNYKSGYIVNLKGDTLRGYINFKEWSYNPESIGFKSTLTDKARELGLADINYFEVSGYTSYKAYTVSISLNSTELSSLSAALDTTTTNNRIFLKVLETGKYVTLYGYRDNLKPRFYIQDNSMAVPDELLYGMYQDPNSSTNIISKNSYQAQLNQLATKYKPNDDQLITQVQQSSYKD